MCDRCPWPIGPRMGARTALPRWLPHHFRCKLVQILDDLQELPILPLQQVDGPLVRLHWCRYFGPRHNVVAATPAAHAGARWAACPWGCAPSSTSASSAAKTPGSRSALRSAIGADCWLDPPVDGVAICKDVGAVMRTCVRASFCCLL